MGLIGQLFNLIFGDGRNMVAQTAEVFRENAEAGAQRGQAVQMQAMKQHGAEFSVARQGMFDRFIDGINRLPRPALAFGTLGLFVSAMVDPIWFATRMQGIMLVPEPLWWLLGVIVSFYFGARHQVKAQDFQRDIAKTMARVPQVLNNIKSLGALRGELRADSPGLADTGTDVRLALASVSPAENPALEAWHTQAA